MLRHWVFILLAAVVVTAAPVATALTPGEAAATVAKARADAAARYQAQLAAKAKADALAKMRVDAANKAKAAALANASTRAEVKARMLAADSAARLQANLKANAVKPDGRVAGKPEAVTGQHADHGLTLGHGGQAHGGAHGAAAQAVSAHPH